MCRRPLLEARRISRRRTAKNRCCSKVHRVSRTFRRYIRKYSVIKGCDLKCRDLKTVPMGCCRVCIRHGNSAAGRIAINTRRRTWNAKTRTMATGI
ncbi:hypothetical protein AVEN_142586-1 [Araneus ventricosus]|uniref:Uncharacterized protein n=1 Tax=Araneus ventricosus TaxID=182803 RepID=A0A4Y2CHE1_ARAVE|nr:hypothetical protein AVEN_142586-1 [Araneus ventricosus]